MKSPKYIILSCILTLMLSLSGCGQGTETAEPSGQQTQEAVENTQSDSTTQEENVPSISLAYTPDYAGDPYVVVNNNQPEFAESEMTTSSFETYSDLDVLGRCGIAYANIGQDLMPTEERGNISDVKPSGWQSVEYDGIDGGYLYNRCHLIGFQLTAENANEKNLITGTRYLNMKETILSRAESRWRPSPLKIMETVFCSMYIVIMYSLVLQLIMLPGIVYRPGNTLQRKERKE